MPSLVVVLDKEGGWRRGKLAKAELAVQGSRGKSCHVQTCVAAGAVGSVPLRLFKDIAVSQRGLWQWVSVSRPCGTRAKSLSWRVTFSKQALGFLLPSLDLVTFLLIFTWAWKCNGVPCPCWLVPKSWISVLCISYLSVSLNHKLRNCMLIYALGILTQSYQLNVTFDISCTFSFFFFLIL